MRARRLRRMMNLWPPFLFTGIRVGHLSDDYRSVRVELRQRWWNRNAVGTHFGGSLFAMTDPFWMLLVLHHLGHDHVVWDRAAEIRFVRPGRGTVTADFLLTDEHLDALRAATVPTGRGTLWFDTRVVDAAGEVVATVRKEIYVRRKAPAGTPAGTPAGAPAASGDAPPVEPTPVGSTARPEPAAPATPGDRPAPEAAGSGTAG